MTNTLAPIDARHMNFVPHARPHVLKDGSEARFMNKLKCTAENQTRDHLTYNSGI